MSHEVLHPTKIWSDFYLKFLFLSFFIYLINAWLLFIFHLTWVTPMQLGWLHAWTIASKSPFWHSLWLRDGLQAIYTKGELLLLELLVYMKGPLVTKVVMYFQTTFKIVLLNVAKIKTNTDLSGGGDRKCRKEKKNSQCRKKIRKERKIRTLQKIRKEIPSPSLQVYTILVTLLNVRITKIKTNTDLRE